MEEFDFDHQRSLKRDTIAHLGTLDLVTAKDNVVFLGPPGAGKTHLSIGLGIRACQTGHPVAFATAAQWVMSPVRVPCEASHCSNVAWAGPLVRRPVRSSSPHCISSE